MADGSAQVALVIRVTASGSKGQCTLLPPPEGSPSWKWTRKLWSSLKPSLDNSWAAIVQGNLKEVFSHLWKHQALFFQLGDAEEAEHLCVHFSELLDPSDVASKKLVRDVELDEEFTSEGRMTISLQLFDLREPLEDVDADLSQLVTPSDGFLLSLRLQEGVPGEALSVYRSCERLQLRLDSVETTLDLARSNDSVVYQFPLVDSWEDLREALSDLHVCLQLEDETSDREIPVDLSHLIAAVGESGGSGLQGDVSVEVRSAPVMSLEGGLPFLASISHSNQTAAVALSDAGKDLDIWDRGARLLAVGPRHWRFSIEIRSVRLTERGANVFVSYSYPPLKQPRPFRTNPPNLLRKKATVSMPHSFAAYTLTSNFDDLQAGLEASPLYLEVWHRDLYRKDSVVGIAEADLSQLSSQPLQRNSIKLPSSVEGFRTLDQVCPIISEDESQVGSLRVVVFLEDLGLVPGSKVDSSDRRNVAKSEKAPATYGPAVAAVKSHRQVRTPGQDDLVAPLKGAYELEMWRQAEEEKFRVYLLEQEQELQDRLEEEFRQKEELRAADFAERKAKLQELEGNVRRKLQELQERELAVVAEETKVSTLKEETKRRMGMAVSQHEDATKREAIEAEHRLELSRQRSQFLEEQCQQLETKLEAQLLKVSALQQKQLERRLPPEATVSAPSADLSEELHGLRMQLREQQLKNEAIAASRDHFKRKVEDLCSRLGGTCGTSRAEAPTQPTASAGTPQGPDLVSALRQVQEDLAKLADSWTETPKRTPAARSTQATPESTQKLTAMRAAQAQDPVRQEQHLAWLRSQHHELLESGLYGSGDPVLQALALKIAQAEAHLRVATMNGAERK